MQGNEVAERDKVVFAKRGNVRGEHCGDRKMKNSVLDKLSSM